MANFRRMPDGSIVFPARGLPPMEVPGFEPTDDPYVFKPKMVECQWRTTKDVRLKCGKLKSCLYCVKKDLIDITHVTCENCDVPDKT